VSPAAQWTESNPVLIARLRKIEAASSEKFNEKEKEKQDKKPGAWDWISTMANLGVVSALLVYTKYGDFFDDMWLFAKVRSGMTDPEARESKKCLDVECKESKARGK